ncbi:MAG: methyltransferase [Pseudomonadota bacterium]
MSVRLALALEAGTPSLPASGPIAVFAPRDGFDLSPLPKDRCIIVTGFKPDFDRFEAQGYRCTTVLETRVAASIICVPRAKALAQALVAEAAGATDGPIIVDGVKTDGVEAIYKACRKRADASRAISKAHGKLFHFEARAAFDDWLPEARPNIDGGFVTAPGIFSADGVDPASRLLADGLPDKLGARAADLGAGWGYLSARVLERDGVETLHLVEAEHAALTCAKANISDSRARFHWADAATWEADAPLDCVIMNPPFHTSRKAEPHIGQSFIQAACRLLTPRGQLFLVANRHLPYEGSLEQSFSEVTEFGGDARFKLLSASRPKSGSRKRSG